MSNCTARTRPAYVLSRARRRSVPWAGTCPGRYARGCVRIDDASLDEVRERGFCLVEGFLAPDELAAAQQALWLHFPRARRLLRRSGAVPRVTPASQFAGVEEFPYRSWDLNRLAFHPDLVDAAERYLGTTELHLYKVELWAKYAGAANYDQPLHRDYGSHSLVVPRLDARYQQLTTFIFLSDVTDGRRSHPHRPLRGGHGTCRSRPCTSRSARWPTPRCPPSGRPGACWCTGPTSCTGARTSPVPGRSRFSLLADFQARGTTWGGKMAWPKQSPQRWAKLIPQCSVRERDLFGFPRPGDEYWNEQTLADVAPRYPGIDMEPYRPSTPVR